MRPYGYEPDRKTIREAEAVILREAADRLIAGESLRSVVAWMNSAGARTSGGNMWAPVVLSRALRNPRVEPILGKRAAAKITKILSDSARNRGGANSARVYLLTGGIAVCGLCGKPLRARPNNDGKRGYICASGSPYFGCGKIRIVADLFEQEVVERVLGRFLRDDARQRLADAAQEAHVRADAAPGSIASAQEKLEEIAADYADGRVTASQLHVVTARLQEKIRAARGDQRLGETLGELTVLDAENLVEWWEQASLEDQHALLNIIVKSIEVHPAIVRGSKVFDPRRIKIRW